MQAVLHWNIDMAIEITSKGGVFFATADFFVVHNLAKRPCFGPFNNNCGLYYY
jgi:hypothetical protein